MCGRTLINELAKMFKNVFTKDEKAHIKNDLNIIFLLSNNSSIMSCFEIRQNTLTN
jgi:hypothetical protein